MPTCNLYKLVVFRPLCGLMKGYTFQIFFYGLIPPLHPFLLFCDQILKMIMLLMKNLYKREVGKMKSTGKEKKNKKADMESSSKKKQTEIKEAKI